MIFITVGSQKFPMNRIFIEVDRLIEEKKIDQEVIAQIGTATYKPRNFKYKQFYSKEEMICFTEKCDLLITHAGSSSIMTGLKNLKKIIVIPRRAELGEHVDNHQFELSEVMSKQNYVIEVQDIENLYEAIIASKTKEIKEYISGNKMIIDILRQEL